VNYYCNPLWNVCGEQWFPTRCSILVNIYIYIYIYIYFFFFFPPLKPPFKLYPKLYFKNFTRWLINIIKIRFVTTHYHIRINMNDLYDVFVLVMSCSSHCACPAYGASEMHAEPIPWACPAHKCFPWFGISSHESHWRWPGCCRRTMSLPEQVSTVFYTDSTRTPNCYSPQISRPSNLPMHKFSCYLMIAETFPTLWRL